MNQPAGPDTSPEWPANPGRIVQIPEPPSMGPTFEALHDYCTTQVDRIQKDRNNLEGAYLIYKEYDQEKAHEMERVDWLRQGEQIALRNLLEYFGINHD